MLPEDIEPQVTSIQVESSAEAPPEGTTKTPEEPTPKEGTPEADAAAIALFDKAMESDPDTKPLPEGEPPDTGKPAQAKPAEGEAAPAPTTGAEAAKPAPTTVAATATATGAEDEAVKAANAKIEKEIADLRLKGSPAARFRELSHQVRELSAIRDEQLPVLQETARLHNQWQAIVAESTATAPQLEQALAYIQSVNSGDPERLALAAKAMMSEVTWAYKKLGWELPGIVDPLEDHPDLVALVNEGDINREGALEIVKARAVKAANDSRKAAVTQAATKEDDYVAAVEAVGPQIDALSERLKATDPLFLAKLPALKPTIDLIKETIHPSRWPAAIERAYKALPAPAAPPPRPGRVQPMPIRPTGGGNANASTVRKFTPEQVAAGDPFDMGVREASG